MKVTCRIVTLVNNKIRQKQRKSPDPSWAEVEKLWEIEQYENNPKEFELKKVIQVEVLSKNYGNTIVERQEILPGETGQQNITWHTVTWVYVRELERVFLYSPTINI